MDQPRLFHRLSVCNTILYAFVFLMTSLAYNHFFWDTPYLSFLWMENIFYPLISGLGGNWTAYTSGEPLISSTKVASILFGSLFLLAAILSFFIKYSRFSSLIIRISVFIYFLYLTISWISDDFYLPFLIEKSAQVGTVAIFFILLIRQHISGIYILNIIKIFVGFTFIIHGLFAIGIFPVPGKFTDMTISLLHVDEQQAKLFLKVIGVFDISFSFGLFFRKTEKISFIYAIIWGFLTALARILANISLDYVSLAMHRWIFEFLIRTPHFLLPLAGILMRMKNVNTTDDFNCIKHFKTT